MPAAPSRDKPTVCLLYVSAQATSPMSVAYLVDRIAAARSNACAAMLISESIAATTR
jgi:hypothetical protein